MIQKLSGRSSIQHCAFMKAFKEAFPVLWPISSMLRYKTAKTAKPSAAVVTSGETNGTRVTSSNNSKSKATIFTLVSLKTSFYPKTVPVPATGFLFREKVPRSTISLTIGQSTWTGLLS